MKRPVSPLRRSLYACTFDGVFFSAMTGFGDHYFSAFALFLGAEDFQVGLLATLPMLLAAGFQLFSPAAAHRFGEKRWVLISATAQALVFLPIAALPWTAGNDFAWLLPFVCLYWMLGTGLHPAWSAWIARMIPVTVRSRYFGRRNAPVFLSLLLSGLAGGMLLHAAKQSGWGAAWGFCAVFVLAACFRLASAWCMSRQIEVPPDAETMRAHRRAGFRERLGSGPHTHLISLLVALTASVHISAPYFAPFMLSRLELSYAEFTLINSAALIGRAVSSRYWGEMARAYGSRRALQVAACLIVPLSALWVVSQNFYYLVCVQLFAGFAWAGMDLTNMLNFFDCTDDRNRADVISVYYFCNGAAVVVGATIGGLILRQLGPSAYPVLFVGSALLRLTVVLALARGVGVRRARERTFPEVFVRVLTFARAGARP